MYDVSYNSFIKFNRHLDIPFAEIDVDWLKRYEFWMRGHKLSDSTISTRLRHLRTIFNYAISEKAFNPNCSPFSQCRIAKLNQSSPNRSLSKNEIKMIINYEGETRMGKLASDIFLFHIIWEELTLLI